MRATIDMAGRLVVPKSLRDQLGFSAGTDLEMTVVDGHLQVAIPSRVQVSEGPYGPRFVADGDDRFSADQVREIMEQGRR